PFSSGRGRRNLLGLPERRRRIEPDRPSKTSKLESRVNGFHAEANDWRGAIACAAVRDVGRGGECDLDCRVDLPYLVERMGFEGLGAGTMIGVRDLRVDYENVCAVRDLSLEVGTGEVCGLIGPNGAGKTTTMRAMLGLIEPTYGEIELAGVDMRE